MERMNPCFSSQWELWKRWCGAPVLLWCGLFWVAPPGALATEPRVRFDVPHMVACRDVTTEAFLKDHPHEIRLEATLPISAVLVTGREDDLVRCDYRLTNPGRSLRVIEYSPQTTLASAYAGNISVERKEEQTRSAGVTASGAWDHLVRLSGSGDVGSKDTSSLRYELVAPMRVVAASGTLARGTGLYFKLQRSSQSSLEGVQQVTAIFRAPRGWRGDDLRVRCEARGMRRGVVRALDEEVDCGARDFFVALYLAGDLEARRQAERVVAAEAGLQRAIQAHRAALDEMDRVGWPESLRGWWGHRPAGWQARLEPVLFAREPGSRAIPADFPRPVRHALSEYLESRARLRGMNGVNRS